MSQRPLHKMRDAARTILSHILAPLTKHKHHEQELGAFWDELFNAQTRSIVTYRARQRFKLPGLYYVAGSIKVQGIGERQIEREERLYVRQDIETPDQIDVQRRGERVFCLTRQEWNQIRPMLEPMEMKVKLE